MAQGTLRSEQADFGAGIYRGREAPDNAAYDLLNCLIDDEGQPFRRGGSAYRTTTDATAALKGLADAYLAGGRRTVAWESSRFYSVNADDLGITTLTGVAFSPLSYARPAIVNGVMVLPTATDGVVFYYGGSRKTASYSTGTITVTNGSTAVTGVGTSWSANVDAGMLLNRTVTTQPIRSVGSNTSLTLQDPWHGATEAGVAYGIDAYQTNGPLWSSTTGNVVASAGRRLLVGVDNRVFFTPVDDPLTFAVNDYHLMPGGALIVGADGLRDVGVIFTSVGVFGISGLLFDSLDDAGNIQHQVEQINELVLWGDPGVARWQTALVVPAVDNVWLMSLGDPPVPIGDGIRPLYLSYVKAGYQPGTAAVHRGHYFLPILNGTTLVDMLVCRLDRGFAWTRWSGHGAGTAYAQRIGSTTRSPKLLGISGLRAIELTDAWSPSASNASEANATTHPLTIETRDLSTGSGAKGATTRKVKIRYQATAAATPAFTVSYARGPEDAAYTSLGTAIRGGAASDGLDESVWPVGKQAPAIRFRISSTSVLSTFTLREISVEYTPRGA